MLKNMFEIASLNYYFLNDTKKETTLKEQSITTKLHQGDKSNAKLLEKFSNLNQQIILLSNTLICSVLRKASKVNDQ